MTKTKLKFYLNITIISALLVIALGAYTRITNAGLGCPDWPWCYGKVWTYANNAALNVDITKANTEMLHRFAAGSLAWLIIGIVIVDYKQRIIAASIKCALIATIMLQAALGMLTVTMLLHPLIVLGHLFGGFTTLALLWSARLQCSNAAVVRYPLHYPRLYNAARYLTYLAIIVVGGQIILGGWTSANYAALACDTLPSCYGLYFPPHLAQAWHIGNNISTWEYSPLLNIHLLHRVGAILTAMVLVSLSILLLLLGRTNHNYSKFSGLILLLLGMQMTLGILNIYYHLPISSAVAHNIGAASLLLLIITTLWYLHIQGTVHVR